MRFGGGLPSLRTGGNSASTPDSLHRFPRILRLESRGLRIFPVDVPSRWILQNIFLNSLKRFLIADYVFVVVSLPSEICVRYLPDHARRYRLVGTQDFSQCRGAIHRALILVRCRRGRNELRPHENDPVDVIGHYDEHVQSHIRESGRQFAPHRLHDSSCFGQSSLTLGHRTKNTFPVLRADCNEVGARLLVVKPFQPDRSTMMFFWIVWVSHGSTRLHFLFCRERDLSRPGLQCHKHYAPCCGAGTGAMNCAPTSEFGE